MTNSRNEVAMFHFMTVVRALTDENRIRILAALRGRELCVCQVTGLLDLAPSTTSKHLSILRQARLIEGRRRGKWVHYRTADSDSAPIYVREALHFVFESLQNSPEFAADEQRLKLILQSGDCAEELEEERHSPFIHSLVPDAEETQP